MKRVRKSSKGFAYPEPQYDKISGQDHHSSPGDLENAAANDCPICHALAA